ncbi:LysR family transcriptional regulator [Marinomonas sp. CT5]|uniref:LysR family transcriptional regulator n=1 Tax=Marinomonas sp. CT5 TaxID=2066133 RepID=UPI001BB00491|nr:LysR substrate-binding domain-containing protein [Marinomonas sp. CT5]QUX96053.1 LysR family transcriptional regulator [Marinomonas sp. CT5]
MMSLRQIRYFIAIAETGSVSAAASTVFISQSTLTMALRQLEDELGVELFVRHAKGMELTHSGHQFLRQAHLIMSAVDNAKRSLQQSTDDIVGELNIGVTSLVAGYYLADLLSRFQRIYHKVKIRVVEDEREYIEHLLVSGELDVAVLMLSNLEHRSALNTEVLTYSRYHIWLPPEHQLLEEESLSMDLILKEPQILLSTDGMEQRIRDIWQDTCAMPDIAMKSNSVEAVRSLVSAGMGVAVMPDMTYRPWSVEGDRVEAKRILDVSKTLDIGLAWRRGGIRNLLVDHLLEVARESMSKPSLLNQ